MSVTNSPCQNCSPYGGYPGCYDDCRIVKAWTEGGKRDKAFAILIEIYNELLRAEKKHGPMMSTSHGAFVVCQKADELARAVAAGNFGGLNDDIREEAVQVGAMALRFLKDLE